MYILYFNPLPPHGGRPNKIINIKIIIHISIHSLRMEGDPYQVQACIYADVISIHSLRMEGDRRRNIRRSILSLFQSTPSAWRETKHHTASKTERNHFNPLPPHGGRPSKNPSIQSTTTFQSTPSAWRETINSLLLNFHSIISIHSLRMEGDS